MRTEESEGPSFLEIKKTLNKSEYFIYRHRQTNYNCSEVREVHELEQYALFPEKFDSRDRHARTHYGSPCTEPEKSYLEAESEDSSFGEEVFVPKENECELGCFDENKELLAQRVGSIVKGYSNCFMLVAPNDGNNGVEAKTLINLLLEELEDSRVVYEVSVFYYGSKSARVCYLLGTNHSLQDVGKRMEKMDKTKIFCMGEVRCILKLSESLGKKNKQHFEQWEEFFKRYCQWYSKNSLQCKYTINNKKNVKNYVYV